MILKLGKYNISHLQAVFKSWKWHHSWSISDQSNQPIVSLIISTAVFLQGNESAVMANSAAIKRTDVKTKRNSNWKHFFVLLVQIF